MNNESDNETGGEPLGTRGVTPSYHGSNDANALARRYAFDGFQSATMRQWRLNWFVRLLSVQCNSRRQSARLSHSEIAKCTLRCALSLLSRCMRSNLSLLVFADFCECGRGNAFGRVCLSVRSVRALTCLKALTNKLHFWYTGTSSECLGHRWPSVKVIG